MLGKLLGAATVGSTMVGLGVLHRFLMSTAQIVILVIVSAFMLCASLASVFVILYFCLVQFGATPLVAGCVLGLVSLLTTAALVVFTQEQFKLLHRAHYQHMRGSEHNGADLGHVAMAFLDGFLNKKK